jgi:phosphoesterase RecJ-like protein
MEGITKPAAQEGDLLIAVDVAADTMLPRCWDELKNCIDLRIDHHGSGREYTPRELVESDSAACAEIIWELLLDLGVEMDPEMADAIYVGVSTDTGCFRYTNTTAETMRVAANLMELGCDTAYINKAMFETKSKEKVQLEHAVYDTMQYCANGKCAIIKQKTTF